MLRKQSIEERANYFAVHTWLSRHCIKKGKCTNCGKKTRTEWTKKAGKEYSRNIDNFVEACTSCNRKFHYGTKEKTIFIQSWNTSTKKWDITTKKERNSNKYIPVRFT